MFDKSWKGSNNSFFLHWLVSDQEIWRFDT